MLIKADHYGFSRSRQRRASPSQFRKTTFYLRYNWFVTVRPRADYRLEPIDDEKRAAQRYARRARERTREKPVAAHAERDAAPWRIIGRVSQKDRSPAACGLIWGTRFAGRPILSAFAWRLSPHHACALAFARVRSGRTRGMSLPRLLKSVIESARS